MDAKNMAHSEQQLIKQRYAKNNYIVGFIATSGDSKKRLELLGPSLASLYAIQLKKHSSACTFSQRYHI